MCKAMEGLWGSGPSCLSFRPQKGFCLGVFLGLLEGPKTA